MPHDHIFMQQDAVDELLTKTTTGYWVDRHSSIEDYVATIVHAAFTKHASEVLSQSQVVRYPMCITNTMPVDMAVNVTVWYTEERALHLDAIRQEVLDQLSSWAPRYDIEVHIIPIGVPIKRTPAGISHPASSTSDS